MHFILILLRCTPYTNTFIIVSPTLLPVILVNKIHSFSAFHLIVDKDILAFPN